MSIRRLMCAVLAAAVICTALLVQGCSLFGGKESDNITGSFTVGVCQYYDSQSYTDATRGFTDRMKERFGDHVTIEVKQASSSAEKCEKIIKSFVKSKVDLIVANGAPALSCAYKNVKSIPVLAAGVKDYAETLSIKNWDGTVGRNISGTSSAVAYSDQANMVYEWCPSESCAKLGILFSSKDEEARSQAEEMRKQFQEKGYAVTLYTFPSDSVLIDVADIACKESDVLYLPQDKSVDASAEEINGLLLKSKTPAFTSDEKVCSKCGLAALCVSYYEMGKKTADMAFSVLIDKQDISKMPVEACAVVKKYNASSAGALGISVPEGYTALN